MSNNFEDKLGLFPGKRTKESSPHYTGSVVLSNETLKELVSMVKAGKEPKLGAACWVNDWKEGKKRLAVNLSPWKEREEPAPTTQDPFAVEDDLPF